MKYSKVFKVGKFFDVAVALWCLFNLGTLAFAGTWGNAALYGIILLYAIQAYLHVSTSEARIDLDSKEA